MGQQRSVLTPERSAHHLWGSELRALRDLRRLSLAHLGRLTRYDPSYLGRLERARQFPSKDVAEACDHALDAGGELVRLWRMADRERRNADDHVAFSGGHEAKLAPDMDFLKPGQALSNGADDGVVVPCRSADGRIIWVTVPRRTFLLGGVAATAGLAMHPASRGAIRVAPDADLTPIEHLQRMRRVLIDEDNLLGPRPVIPTAHEHVRVIMQLRAGRTGADNRALLHLQAEFGEFAGWLHQDSGDFRQAQFWLDRALEWSHAVGDPDMATYVMARKSQLAGDMRDPQGAVDLADAATSMARPGSRLHATAQTYRAHGLALAREPSGALRALDEARDLAANQPDGQSVWATWLDEAYVDVQRGRCLALLGSHEQAAAVFQQAIRDLPPGFRRDRGVYLAREAQAHAGADDPDQAAATGMQALGIAAETGSGRIINELAALDDRLARWNRVPAVTDFREALTSVIPRETDQI